jgi:hypothetical protein
MMIVTLTDVLKMDICEGRRQKSTTSQLPTKWTGVQDERIA